MSDATPSGETERAQRDRLGVTIEEPAPIPQRWHVTVTAGYDSAEFGVTRTNWVHVASGPPEAAVREAVKAASEATTRAGQPMPWVELYEITLVPLPERPNQE